MPKIHHIASMAAAAAVLASPAMVHSPAAAGLKPGTVKYFNGGLHRPGGSGRPVMPRIVVRHAGDGWRATTQKALFRLDLYVEAGYRSDIRTIWATVQGAPRYLKVLFSKPSGGKARKVRIRDGRFRAHANGLGGVTRMAEGVCATFGPASQGTRILVRKVTLDVRVSSYRHVPQVYRYYPKVDVAIVCERLPGTAPSASNPTRNKPRFRVTTATLRFFKQRKRLCPKQVSLQLNLYGTGEGHARFRIVRSDGRVVQTGWVHIRRTGNRFKGSFVKADIIRRNHNYRYRVVVVGGSRTTSRWVPLRVRCGSSGGGSFKS